MSRAVRKIMAVLCITIMIPSAISTFGQTVGAGNVVYANPSVANPITAAIALLPSSGGEVFMQCGTYVDNINLTRSSIKLVGASRGCVVIEPEQANTAVLTLNAMNNSVINDEFSNLTIECPSRCTDGIKFESDSANQNVDDSHIFSHITIVGPSPRTASNGFQYGVEIAGRSIANFFEDVAVIGSYGDGWHFASSAPLNFNVFRDSSSEYNQDYGVYINNTNSNAAENNVWDHFLLQYNGQNASLANCASFYATGVAGANSIVNGYFEGDCQNNLDSSHMAHVRLTGTYNQGWNIVGNEFNNPYGEWAIYNDTNWTGGLYSGNYVLSGRSFYIATSNPSSGITLINNSFQGAASPTIVADGNGVTHVAAISPATLVNAHSGTLFVCVDVYGNVIAQSTTCSGH